MEKIIVSFTSWPGRIASAEQVVANIWKQTRKPDRILLYLAKEQFPERENNLPDGLLTQAKEGLVDIRWCDKDLKPHKKYFYAMREFPDDLIVTVDDDLLYPSEMIERLYQSYQSYPKAISASRTHLMLIDDDQNFLPYKYWPQETDICLNQPTMHLLATTGAGTMYPPHLLNLEDCTAEVIESTCLFADDLWMKVLEIAQKIPVVLAAPNEPLVHIENTAETAIWRDNVDGGGNDAQLNDIVDWFNGKYGERFIQTSFSSYAEGINLITRDMMVRAMADRADLRVKRKIAEKVEVKKELNKELHKLQKQYGTATAELERLNQENQQQKAQLLEAQNESEKARQEIQQLKEQLLEAQNEAEKDRQEIQRMTEEQNKAKKGLFGRIRS